MPIYIFYVKADVILQFGVFGGLSTYSKRSSTNVYGCEIIKLVNIHEIPLEFGFKIFSKMSLGLCNTQRLPMYSYNLSNACVTS